MERYEEMVAKHFCKQAQTCIHAQISKNAAEIVAAQSYQTLEEIKKILEDDLLNDQECFLKIEEIVRIFEALESGAGNRHDFG